MSSLVGLTDIIAGSLPTAVGGSLDSPGALEPYAESFGYVAPKFLLG